LQAYINVWASDVELICDWDYEVKLSHPFSWTCWWLGLWGKNSHTLALECVGDWDYKVKTLLPFSLSKRWDQDNQHWTYFRKVLSFTPDCWGRVVVRNITTMQVWRRIHLEEYVKICKEFASQLPQLPQHTEDWSPLVFILWVGNHNMLIHLLHPIAHFFLIQAATKLASNTGFVFWENSTWDYLCPPLDLSCDLYFLFACYTLNCSLFIYLFILAYTSNLFYSRLHQWKSISNRKLNTFL
jgi:hypothetical protein